MKKFLLSSVLLILVQNLTSCFNEHCCPDPSRLPSGMVILTERVFVYNGETARIEFRVNPSDYEVKTENLLLDYTVSSTTTSRASYDETSEEYALLGVEPASDDSGNVRQGQWTATIRQTGGGTFIGSADLHLVLRSADGMAEVSSEKIEVMSVPAMTEQLLSIKSPVAVTYKLLDEGEINPAYIYIPKTDMMREAEVIGIDWITEMKAEILPGKYSSYFTASRAPVSGNNKSAVYVTPSEALFQGVRPEDFPITADVRITVTDIAGATFVKNTSISFYDHTIVVPASETGLEFVIGEQLEYHIEMGSILARMGITRDVFENNPDLIHFISYSAEGPDDALGVVLEEYSGPEEGHRDITVPADFRITFVDFIMEPDTYYGVFVVALTDPYEMRFVPTLGAVIKLEIIAK